MKINQSNPLKFSLGFSNFYYLDSSISFVDIKNNIGYLSTFLISDFGSIKNDLEKNIQYYFIDRDGIGFPLTMVVLDGAKTMVYIGIMPDPCDYDNDDYPYISGKTELEHFQENLLDHLIISKDNFFCILRLWNKYLEKKPLFLLLYQDENNWFDLEPFSSKEEMEKFVKNHTSIMNE